MFSITLLPLFLLKSVFAANIKYQIQNSGFHRDLTYEIFPDEVHKDDHFLIVQNLPASIFINSDQLNDLKRINHLEYYIPIQMDVELPATKGIAFQFYVFRNSSNPLKFSLPIHLRYQAPTEMKFVRVEVQGPSLYKLCTPNTPAPELCEPYPCPNTSSFTYLRPTNIDVCNWRKLVTDHTTVSILVPAAYVYSYKFVMPITLVVSWLGCLYICYIVCKKSSQLKIKKG